MPLGTVRGRRKHPATREGTMSDQQEPKGKVDAVAVLYILGGIPAIVAFVVILFAIVKWTGNRFPA
jgi:uncharacterized membrane protein